MVARRSWLVACTWKTTFGIMGAPCFAGAALPQNENLKPWLVSGGVHGFSETCACQSDSKALVTLISNPYLPW